MKKILLLTLCLILLLLPVGCASDGNGNENGTSAFTPTSTLATTSPVDDGAKYVQPPIQSPLSDDKYPTVSHITIYKSAGMRYDITDRKEIEKICDYYKTIKGEFSETRVTLYDLPSNEKVDREIRFFSGGYSDGVLLGALQLTSAGRYVLQNGDAYDLYKPAESNASAYMTFFDEIFSSQKQPYMDVYTR